MRTSRLLATAVAIQANVLAYEDGFGPPRWVHSCA
jgi:hypothetical protein